MSRWSGCNPSNSGFLWAFASGSVMITEDNWASYGTGWVLNGLGGDSPVYWNNTSQAWHAFCEVNC